MSKKSVFSVVGGGRWGRVALSVLAKMKTPFKKIVIVSKYNQEPIYQLINKELIPATVCDSIDQLLVENEVKAALIVNSAADHFETADRFLENKIPILVEKPLALSLQQAQCLIQKAESNRICLIPGLNYRFSSYLYRLAELIAQSKKIPKHVSIEWLDAAGESRYGEMKKYDQTIDVAQDVMPHIWSIFQILFPSLEIYIDTCIRCLGMGFGEFLIKGGIEGRVVLARDAVKRSRKILIEWDLGERVSLDFTKEPGIFSQKGGSTCADPEWESRPTPLTQQFSYFFSQIEKTITSSDSRACLESVAFTEKASRLLRNSFGTHSIKIEVGIRPDKL